MFASFSVFSTYRAIVVQTRVFVRVMSFATQTLLQMLFHWLFCNVFLQHVFCWFCNAFYNTQHKCFSLDFVMSSCNTQHKHFFFCWFWNDFCKARSKNTSSVDFAFSFREQTISDTCAPCPLIHFCPQPRPPNCFCISHFRSTRAQHSFSIFNCVVFYINKTIRDGGISPWH